MILKDDQPNWVRRYGQEDVVASALRVGLAAAGPIGSVIAEFITQFVPQQRVDRLHDFADQLSDRVGSLEEFRARIEASPAFATLLEEATLAAVRTANPSRRRDLAELLRTGLSKTDAELVAHDSLLRTLETLNEPEVLILVAYGLADGTAMNDPTSGNFVARFPEVFVDPVTFGGDPKHQRRRTMFEHYQDELLSRGLLVDREGIVKGSAFRRQLEITELGRMLLEAIGRGRSEAP